MRKGSAAAAADRIAPWLIFWLCVHPGPWNQCHLFLLSIAWMLVCLSAGMLACLLGGQYHINSRQSELVMVTQVRNGERDKKEKKVVDLL